MTEDEFWQLIDQARSSGSPEGQLEELLTPRSPQELAEFDAHFRNALRAGYSWDVWGAGYVAEGGMSDDGFEYFLTWLIMQGRAAFQQVISDPDSLADLPEPEAGYEMEGPQYVAATLYADRTDGNWPDGPSKFKELGEGWDFDDDDEMGRRYPRLTALHG